MPDSIQINQNSLIKLVVRKGYNVDRLQTVLDVGEPGYTIDTNRLYIGDGATLGGNLVGNLYKGTVGDVTSIATPVVGDTAYDTSRNFLYAYEGGNPATIGNWQAVGGIYSAGDSTISISNNAIRVNQIPQNIITQQALGSSLTLNSGQITLSSAIIVDKIVTSTPATTYLSLPSLIISNNINYTLPSALLGEGVLKTDNAGVLEWTNINTLLSSLSTDLTIGTGLVATVNSVEESEITLLPGLNIALKNRFAAIGHASIKQNGQLLKDIKCTSVVCKPTTSIVGRPIFGADLSVSPTANDYVAPLVGGDEVTGVYEITFDFPLLASYVYDVRVINGGYKRPTDSGQIFNTVIEPYYWISDTNKILVALYTTSTYITINNNSLQTITGPSYLTPGYQNEATRINITIYDGA